MEEYQKDAKANEALWKKEQQTSLAMTKKVDSFLYQNGYGNDVNGDRKAFFKTFHPLHDAVSIGDPLLVEGLIAFGADPTLRSSDGKTPLQIAQGKKQTAAQQKICQLLQAAQGGS